MSYVSEALNELNTIKADYIALTEANINRIANGHDKDGYVIISASRENRKHIDNDIDKPLKKNPDELNDINTKKLRDELYKSGYSWIPVYGGYHEQGSDKTSIEKSFIVYPYKKEIKVDFYTFLRDIYKLMTKTEKNSDGTIYSIYDQDSMLIKRPNQSATYLPLKTVDNNGDRISRFNPGDEVVLNDTDQTYFSAVKKWKDMSLNKKNHDWADGKPQRFSYTEMYLANQPMTIMEAHRRSLSGELVKFGFNGID